MIPTSLWASCCRHTITTPAVRPQNNFLDHFSFLGLLLDLSLSDINYCHSRMVQKVYQIEYPIPLTSLSFIRRFTPANGVFAFLRFCLLKLTREVK